MNKLETVLYAMVIITAILGTVFFMAVGGYFLYRGFKYWKKDSSTTWKTFCVGQILVGTFFLIGAVSAWCDKEVKFNVGGLEYHGSENMVVMFIMATVMLTIGKDFLAERMKVIKAIILRIELEDQLEQEYNEKSKCFTDADEVKYILNNYLSDIEKNVFNKKEAYKIHQYIEDVNKMDKKKLKNYDLKEMKKKIGNLF